MFVCFIALGLGIQERPLQCEAEHKQWCGKTKQIFQLPIPIRQPRQEPKWNDEGLGYTISTKCVQKVSNTCK